MMAQLQGKFDDYNSHRLHSAYVYLPPTMFMKKISNLDMQSVVDYGNKTVLKSIKIKREGRY